jgi:hypothetical protein
MGQVRPRPVSGQPGREATSSTVEGMFRSPASSRGAAQQRGALLAAGRGEPQVLDPGQGQP